MSLDEQKELIPVPKGSLLFGVLCLYLAIEYLAQYWEVSADECYEMLAPHAYAEMKKLLPFQEAEIIEVWTKTVMERKREQN